jgi:hypothetical protein
MPVPDTAGGMRTLLEFADVPEHRVFKARHEATLKDALKSFLRCGTKSEYVWSIRQTGSTLSIENVGGKTAKSKGRIEGDEVFAQDFATQNGKLSDDGMKIKWSDGVVWKKVASAADLSGTWIGYYADGSKSEYVWAIKQTSGTLLIENVGGKTAKSRGRVEGDKVFAQDFATQNGKLSADGTKINWTDGVVWKKQ